MSNKLALCALLLVAFVFSASVSVEAQKRKLISPTDIMLEPTTDTIVPEAESGNLDQCNNGAIKNLPTTIDCADSAWVNGSSQAQNSHFVEDGYQFFRIRFGGLTQGQRYTITLGYDIYNGTSGGFPVHAYDFLGSYNASSPTPAAARDHGVFPCRGGVNTTTNPACSGADPGPSGLTPILPDPTYTRNQYVGQSFAIWGGNFNCVADVPNNLPACGMVYTLQSGNERQLTLTFVADTPNPVIAWSAHISWRVTWSPEQTAADINGASYHMRLKPGIFGGQQDMSLQTSAIITTGPSAAPATIAGRVVDRYGRGIYNARIQLFDITDGTAKEARTNSFGYYRFDDMNVGDSYVMSVSHLRYKFVNGSISFSLDQDMFDMNFVAN